MTPIRLRTIACALLGFGLAQGFVLLLHPSPFVELEVELACLGAGTALLLWSWGRQR